MQALQLLPRKSIVFGIAVVGICIVLFKSFGDVPLEYYQYYGPGEPVRIDVNNDRPLQDGYFKDQPEWNFNVPDSSRSWSGSSRKPRNSDIVVLTASDGGGHNSAIPNVLARVLEDRQSYCDRHGYTNLWLNTSRYDIKEAHRTWSKIPAVAEAFHLHPTAEWVWLIDTDIILMNPGFSLVDEILSPSALESGLLRHEPILDGIASKNPPTNVFSPETFRAEDMHILMTQDHQEVNTGSVFFRRTAFTRYMLEIMTDYKLFMGQEHPGAEQDAIKHLLLEHPLIREHVGIYPQRKFNAYVQGGKKMGYRDGDLLVHFAGCWTGNKCQEWFEEFWGKRGDDTPWRPPEKE